MKHCYKGGFSPTDLFYFHSKTTMNQQIKQRWIEALKSDEYRQGYEGLRHNDKFCCLGVLTDLYIKENGFQWRKDVGGCWSFDGEGGVLPASVQKWAGFDDANPLILGHCATDHNDGTNASFNEIAGYIEQDPNL